MKQNETLSNIHLKDGKIIITDEEIDAVGDNHISTSVNTPMREGAFDKTEDEKIASDKKRREEEIRQNVIFTAHSMVASLQTVGQASKATFSNSSFLLNFASSSFN